MKQRIGEALIGRGAVSEAQVEAALGSQRENGGRVGSILLQMGAVDETELSEVLASLLRGRRLPPKLMDRLERTAPKLLPRKIVLKHRVLPIRRIGRTLHLLAADYANLAGLSTATGCRIQPWIAPEVRVERLLERHFGIRPDPAYDESRAESTEAASDLRSSHAAQSPTVIEGFESLGERLMTMEDASHAVRAVLDHASRFMPACVFFRVQGETARILAANGITLDDAAQRSLAVPAWSGTPLELLVVGPRYRGPVPDAKPYRAFFDKLGLAVPGEIFLLPIRLTDKVFGIFMGASGPGQKLTCSDDVSVRLARMLVLALTLTLLKDKMRHAARGSRSNTARSSRPAAETRPESRAS